MAVHNLPAGSAQPAAMGSLRPAEAVRLVLHQARYDVLVFRRNRQSTFFTLALPVIFLVIFASTFRSDVFTLVTGERIKGARYYVPQIVALAIVSASFSNVVSTVIAQRETGVLKRRRSTPVPAWVIVVSRGLTAVVIAFAIVVVLLAVARIGYGVSAPVRTLPGVILTTLIGALSFCCIAYALTTFIDSSESAQPVIQAITLPIFFISGVFFPEDIVPGWLLDVANFFPVRHLALALLAAFGRTDSGNGIAAADLANLAVWGAVGAIVATRRFSWTPRTTQP